jgi:hypothetical protein
VLAAALSDPEARSRILTEGARALGEAGLPVSFDPGDPRPLVLSSSDGRRRRVEAATRAEAAKRLEDHPEDITPHAALRPVTQACALPVVAQVCGPSEILYLGQARALHALHGQVPPILVPRLEATRVPASKPRALEEAVSRERTETPWMESARQLLEQGERFVDDITRRDDGLRARAERFRRRLRRDVRRLAEAPAWRGRAPASVLQLVRPRGRPQDTVLAWVLDAWGAGDPAAWGRHIAGLCRPLEPPVHIVHTLPWDHPDG